MQMSSVCHVGNRAEAEYKPMRDSYRVWTGRGGLNSFSQETRLLYVGLRVRRTDLRVSCAAAFTMPDSLSPLYTGLSAPQPFKAPLHRHVRRTETDSCTLGLNFPPNPLETGTRISWPAPLARPSLRCCRLSAGGGVIARSGGRAPCRRGFKWTELDPRTGRRTSGARQTSTDVRGCRGTNGVDGVCLRRTDRLLQWSVSEARCSSQSSASSQDINWVS